MSKFRKKPVVIEAVQYTGTNGEEVQSFVGENIMWNSHAKDAGGYILTLEGEMQFIVTDYIIRGVKGEFYPCKEDIFLATYEPVE